MNSDYKILNILAPVMTFFLSFAVGATPIKVGVSVSLSGEAAVFGQDMERSIRLALEDIGAEKYELIFEDEKCSGKTAVDVANKFINIDKVSYVIGFSCNQALIPAAPVYQRAGIPVIASFATTGDVVGIGDKVFRVFPADQHAIKVLYPRLRQEAQKIGIITEESEFPELLRRELLNQAKQFGDTERVIQDNFKTDQADLRSLLLRFKQKKVDVLFLNPNADLGFVRLMKQMAQIHYRPKIFTAYWPASRTVQDELGSLQEGVVFANLPDTKTLLSASGLTILERYRKKYGEPNSVPYVVGFGYEPLRLLDQAIRNGQDVPAYLRSVQVTDSPIGRYHFDSDGAIVGIAFEIQQVKDGKISTLRYGGSSDLSTP